MLARYLHLLSSRMFSFEHIAVDHYCDVVATDKTGSSSDDWIYYQLVTHSLINYTYTQAIQFYVSHLHTLQSTAAHALGFSVHTSRLPAMDLDAQTVTVLHSKYST
jgi:hypothetical protein